MRKRRNLALIIFLIGYGILSASQYDILKKEYSILEKKLLRYEEGKSLRFSEIEYLEIQKNLVMKNIEIIHEDNRMYLEKLDVLNNLSKTDKSIELTEKRLSEYMKKIDLMKQNPDKIKKAELDRMQYMVKYFTNEKNKAEREKELLKIKLLKYREINESEKSGSLNEMIKAEYSILSKIVDRELSMFKIENRGRKDIAEKTEEAELIKLKIESEQEKITNEKREKENLIFDLKEDLSVCTAECDLVVNELSVLREKVNRGISGENEYTTKDLSYYEIQYRKIELEMKIKYIEEELKKM